MPRPAQFIFFVPAMYWLCSNFVLIARTKISFLIFVVVFAICNLLDLESDYLTTRDFRPRFIDLHDAVIRALDEEKMLPNKSRNEPVLLNQRAQLATKVTTMIWESYDRYRRHSLWKDKTNI
jgi:hypothetical protein